MYIHIFLIIDITNDDNFYYILCDIFIECRALIYFSEVEASFVFTTTTIRGSFCVPYYCGANICTYVARENFIIAVQFTSKYLLYTMFIESPAEIYIFDCLLVRTRLKIFNILNWDLSNIDRSTKSVNHVRVRELQLNILLTPYRNKF